MPFDQAKVDSQLAELTLEEKVSLLGGSGFATTVGIPRLGIQSMNVRILPCFPRTSGSINGC